MSFVYNANDIGYAHYSNYSFEISSERSKSRCCLLPWRSI